MPGRSTDNKFPQCGFFLGGGSEKTLIFFFSLLEDNFKVQNSGLVVFSLYTLNVSLHSLLTCMVSGEKLVQLSLFPSRYFFLPFALFQDVFFILDFLKFKYGMSVCAKSLQLCPTLCDPMGHSPGSSVHGILQARILEWVAMSSSRGSSQPSDQTHVFYVSNIGRWVLYH